MMRSTAIVTLPALVLVAACGGGGGNETVGAASREEAAQLDNAAEMLDASPDSLAAPENVPLETESNSGGAAENTM
jgi:hypothetical protein